MELCGWQQGDVGSCRLLLSSAGLGTQQVAVRSPRPGAPCPPHRVPLHRTGLCSAQHAMNVRPRVAGLPSHLGSKSVPCASSEQSLFVWDTAINPWAMSAVGADAQGCSASVHTVLEMLSIALPGTHFCSVHDCMLHLRGNSCVCPGSSTTGCLNQTWVPMQLSYTLILGLCNFQASRICHQETLRDCRCGYLSPVREERGKLNVLCSFCCLSNLQRQLILMGLFPFYPYEHTLGTDQSASC